MPADIVITVDNDAVSVVAPVDDIVVTVDNDSVTVVHDPTDILVCVDNTPVSLFIGAEGVTTLVAGEAISVGDLVTMSAGGLALKARAGHAFGRYRVVGVALATVMPGAMLSILIDEEHVVPVRFAVAPGAGDNGSWVFLAATAGLATLTPPTGTGNHIIRVGILRGADGSTVTPQVFYRVEHVGRVV